MISLFQIYILPLISKKSVKRKDNLSTLRIIMYREIDVKLPSVLLINITDKPPGLRERGTRWDKKTPVVRGHSCTEKDKIASEFSRLHVVTGLARKAQSQKGSVQANGVMSKENDKLQPHFTTQENCMLSQAEKGKFVNSFIPSSPLAQKAVCQEQAVELTSCEDQEEMSDAGQSGVDSSVESSCEAGYTATNQQMNKKAISIKIRKIPTVSCSKGSVEGKEPQAWEIVPAVEGKSKESCSVDNEEGNSSELLISNSDKQTNTLQCAKSKAPASFSKLVQPDTISQQDCASKEDKLEEKHMAKKQELILFPTKKNEKTSTASKNLPTERGSQTAAVRNKCWITIENINPHFKGSDVRNLLEVCGPVESYKRPVTQFDKTASKYIIFQLCFS